MSTSISAMVELESPGMYPGDVQIIRLFPPISDFLNVPAASLSPSI